MKVSELIKRLQDALEEARIEDSEFDPIVMYEDPRMGFSPVFDVELFKFYTIMIT